MVSNSLIYPLDLLWCCHLIGVHLVSFGTNQNFSFFLFMCRVLLEGEGPLQGAVARFNAALLNHTVTISRRRVPGFRVLPVRALAEPKCRIPRNQAQW